MNNEQVYASVGRDAIDIFESYCEERGIAFTIDNDEQSDRVYKCQMTPEEMRETCEKALQSVFLYHSTNGLDGETYSAGGTIPVNGDVLAVVEELKKKVEEFEPEFNDFKTDYEKRMSAFEEHLRKLLGIETLYNKKGDSTNE